MIKPNTKDTTVTILLIQAQKLARWICAVTSQDSGYPRKGYPRTFIGKECEGRHQCSGIVLFLDLGYVCTDRFNFWQFRIYVFPDVHNELQKSIILKDVFKEMEKYSKNLYAVQGHRWNVYKRIIQSQFSDNYQIENDWKNVQ